MSRTFGSSKRLLLKSPPIYDGIVGLLSALMAGLEVVLDEKGVVATKEGDFAPRWTGGITKLVYLRDKPPSEISSLFDGKSIIFATSGSTGEPQLIKKGFEGLKNETFELARLYDLQSGDLVTSLVRPFHIYGFLHGLMLPAFVGCETIHWNTSYSLPSLEDGFPFQSDLLVTVPAHYSLVERIWDFAYTRAVVSSGASLGARRSEAIRISERRFEKFWEILGSTETGGIAYRRVDKAQEFKPFPHLSLASEDEGTRIFSPFLAPEENTLSFDLLELTNEGNLIHLGRSDRVFKYAGVRHSLADVENALSDQCNDQFVVAWFELDADSPHGGILTAFIEGERKVLKRELPNSLPFPKRVVFLESFPRDAQGKVRIKDLLERGNTSISPAE